MFILDECNALSAYPVNKVMELLQKLFENKLQNVFI